MELGSEGRVGSSPCPAVVREETTTYIGHGCQRWVTDNWEGWGQHKELRILPPSLPRVVPKFPLCPKETPEATPPPLPAEWGLEIKMRLATENNTTLVIALLCSE